MTAVGLVFIFTYLGLTLCLTVLDLKNHKLKQRMKPQKDRHPGMDCRDPVYRDVIMYSLEFTLLFFNINQYINWV